MTPEKIAATYFDSWKSKDFKTLRTLLDDGVTFDGPLAQIDNAEDCVKGLEKLAESVTKLEIQKVFVDGKDVLTWFDLYTASAGPIPTVDWMHVEDEKIVQIKVIFDPRPMLEEKT